MHTSKIQQKQYAVPLTYCLQCTMTMDYLTLILHAIQDEYNVNFGAAKGIIQSGCELRDL